MGAGIVVVMLRLYSGSRGGRISEQPEPFGDDRRLGAARYPELVEDVGDVTAGGLPRHEESPPDLAVRPTFGDQSQDLDLALAETRAGRTPLPSRAAIVRAARRGLCLAKGRSHRSRGLGGDRGGKVH